METLKDELRRLIVETLELNDVDPADLADTDELFGEKLGLDSIDALELTVALEKRYHIAIPDAEVGKRVFRTLETLAAHVAKHRR